MDVINVSEQEVFIRTSTIYYKKWTVSKARNTIILLHDSLGCTALWREWPEELARILGCDVISYDRRGYGKSENYTEKRPLNYLEQEAEILNELVTYWQIQTPVVFGFSDGASVATIYAGMYPDKLKMLLIEGVHVLIEEKTLQGVQEAQKMLETTKIAHVLEKYHGNKVRDLYEAWTKTWLSDAHQSWNIEHFIPKITVPVLVVQGEFDEFGSMAQMDAFDASPGTVEKCVVKGAAHTAHKEEKAYVFHAVEQFINKFL